MQHSNIVSRHLSLASRHNSATGAQSKSAFDELLNASAESRNVPYLSGSLSLSVERRCGAAEIRAARQRGPTGNGGLVSNRIGTEAQPSSFQTRSASVADQAWASHPRW